MILAVLAPSFPQATFARACPPGGPTLPHLAAHVQPQCEQRGAAPALLRCAPAWAAAPCERVRAHPRRGAAIGGGGAQKGFCFFYAPKDWDVCRCACILTQRLDKCIFLIQNIPTDMLSEMLGLFLPF